jgi:hypothetical protein
VEYAALLDKVQWKSVHQQVVERQMLLFRKYMEGKRLLSSEVFQLEVCDSQIRTSQRIQSRKKKHPLQVQTTRPTNALEEKLAIAEMRRIWNGLEVNLVELRYEAFKNKVKNGDLFKSLLERGVVEIPY